MTKPAKRLAKIGRPRTKRVRLVLSVAKETPKLLRKIAKPYGWNSGHALDFMVKERLDGEQKEVRK